MKRAFRIVPTVYFILLAAFWVAEYHMSLGILNYPAIAVIVVLLVQLFHNQKYIGMFYGIVLSALSVYKILEAVVVYIETVNPTGGSLRFLIIKIVLFGTALAMALAYFKYYFKILKRNNTTTTSV